MKREKLEEKVKLIRNLLFSGEDLRQLKKRDVLAVQEYALDIKDLQLYDDLEAYWILKNLR